MLHFYSEKINSTKKRKEKNKIIMHRVHFFNYILVRTMYVDGKTTLLFAARTTRAALRKRMMKRLLWRFSLSRSFLFFIRSARTPPPREIKDLCTSTPSVFSKGYPTATSNSYPSALLRTRPVYTTKYRECYPRNSVNRANQTPTFSRRFRSL